MTLFPDTFFPPAPEPVKPVGRTLLGTPDLRGRGWTPALIARFLGEPDARKANPVYRSQPPMKLWAEARVLAAEAKPEFVEAKAKAAARVKRGREAAESLARGLVEKAGRMPVTVERMPADELLRRAVASYNRRQLDRWCRVGQWRGDDDGPRQAGEGDSPGFLERLECNFLRHEMTDYNRHLEEVAGRTGTHKAIRKIRERVYAAICEAYPHLKDECARQLERRPEGF